MFFNKVFVHGESPLPYDEESKEQCLPSDPDIYDYIIVGAGTAGSAAAGELAKALPNSTILLIDQGTDHSDLPIVMDNDVSLFLDNKLSMIVMYVFACQFTRKPFSSLRSCRQNSLLLKYSYNLSNLQILLKVHIVNINLHQKLH